MHMLTDSFIIWNCLSIRYNNTHGLQCETHNFDLCIFPSSFHDRANKATYAALRKWWRRWWRAYAYMIIYFKFIHIIAVPIWLYNNNIIIFYSRPKLLILWIVTECLRSWMTFFCTQNITFSIITNDDYDDDDGIRGEFTVSNVVPKKLTLFTRND